MFRVGTTQLANETKIKITYGHTATVWRVNYGLNRREERDDRGFWLDVERGYWVASPFEEDDGKPATETTDPASSKCEKVIPYVEDRKNCLMMEITPVPELKVLASLQAALKHAIQIVYQLEDNELAAEALPDRQKRRQLLFYESAEGGAGVCVNSLMMPGRSPSSRKRRWRFVIFNPAGVDRNVPRAPKMV